MIERILIDGEPIDASLVVRMEKVVIVDKASKRDAFDAMPDRYDPLLSLWREFIWVTTTAPLGARWGHAIYEAHVDESGGHRHEYCFRADRVQFDFGVPLPVGLNEGGA